MPNNHHRITVAQNSSKRALQKAAEPTGDLIGNKTDHKITKVSELYSKIVQKKLKPKILDLIVKYLKKDI